MGSPQPQKRNATSFKPGHQPSAETRARHRAAMQALYANGYVPPQLGRKQSPETLARRAETRRRNALGNKRLQNGYWQVMTMDGYKYEHRVVMERVLGRPLTSDDIVHHINHDPLDNRPENLELTTKSGHNRIHAPHRPHIGAGSAKLPEGQWARHFDACVECGRTDRSHASRGLCVNCYARARRLK